MFGNMNINWIVVTQMQELVQCISSLPTLMHLACCSKDICYAMKLVGILRCHLSDTKECNCDKLCLNRLLHCMDNNPVQRVMNLSDCEIKTMQPLDDPIDHFDHFCHVDEGYSVWILRRPIDMYFSVRFEFHEHHKISEISNYLIWGVFDTCDPEEVLWEMMQNPRHRNFIYTDFPLHSSLKPDIVWNLPSGSITEPALTSIEIEEESTWTTALSARRVALFCNQKLVSEAVPPAPTPMFRQRFLAIALIHSDATLSDDRSSTLVPSIGVRPLLMQVAVPQAIFFSTAFKRLYDHMEEVAEALC